MYWRQERFVMFIGMLPKNLLWLNRITLNDVKLPIHIGNLPENLFQDKSRKNTVVKFCRKDGNFPDKPLFLKATNPIDSITLRHNGGSPSKKLLDKSNTNNCWYLQKDSGIWLVSRLENRDSWFRLVDTTAEGRGPDKKLLDKSKKLMFGGSVGIWPVNWFELR